MRISIISILTAMTLVTLPAMAQDQQTDEPVSVMRSTRSVVSPVAGQRQTLEQVAVDTGIEPMGRINGRIQNRVQNRIRNRIDRHYSPQANATSPFVIASEQTATTGRPRR